MAIRTLTTHRIITLNGVMHAICPQCGERVSMEIEQSDTFCGIESRWILVSHQPLEEHLAGCSA